MFYGNISILYFDLFYKIGYDSTNKAPIAQLAEQVPLKDKVVGSTPTGRTIHNLVGKFPRALARGEGEGGGEIRICLASKCEFGGRAESKK